jgi:hypothetical protein
MISWKQIGEGKVRCEKHGEVFGVGRTCSACADLPQAAAPVKKKRKRVAGNLPTLIEHEEFFVKTSNMAIKRLLDERDHQTMSSGEWARTMDVALKARKFAADMAAYREEERSTENLERSAELLKSRRDFTVDAKQIH